MFSKVKASLAKKLTERNSDKADTTPSSSSASPIFSPKSSTAPSSPNFSKAVRTTPKSLDNTSTSLALKLKQAKNRSLKQIHTEDLWTEDLLLEDTFGGGDSLWNFTIAKYLVDLPTITDSSNLNLLLGLSYLDAVKENIKSLSAARIKLSSALSAFNDSKTSKDYLTTFETITAYLYELNLFLDLMEHKNLPINYDLDIAWSCGLSRKKAEGVSWSRPSVKIPGLFAERPFALLALAGLLLNWASITPETPEDLLEIPLAAQRYLKAASIYEFLSKAIDSEWPHGLERPFDVTPEACSALTHISLHQADLIGYHVSISKPGMSGRLEGILSSAALHLSEAHTHLILAPAAQTGAAKGLVQFVEDGTRLYRGLALLRQARRFEQENDRRAINSASRAKKTLQAASPNDRSNTQHSTLLTKFSEYSSQLKEQLARIDKAVSSWDALSPNSTESSDIFPECFSIYSSFTLSEKDIKFSRPSRKIENKSEYLLQNDYY